MHKILSLMIATVFVFSIDSAMAQPPGRRDAGPRGAGVTPDPTIFVTRMMKFDANRDEKLTRDEITDARLISLFDRSDENHDGIVTKDELMTLNLQELARTPSRPGREGVGERGGGTRRDVGRGNPRPAGLPPVGEVFPARAKDLLKLSTSQRKKIDALQKQVDSRLEQILTEEQKQQLDEMRDQSAEGDHGPFDHGPFDHRQEPGGLDLDGRSVPSDAVQPQKPSE